MRLIRQIVAVVSLLAATLYLGGISSKLIPLAYISSIQLVPAILSLSIVSLLTLSVLSLLLGRVYCSAICPLGILQDLYIRLSQIFQKKKPSPKTRYRKPHTILRYTLLLASVLLLILGSSSLLLILDPYSIFGRFISSTIVPAINFVNNSLAWACSQMDSYAFIYKTYQWPGSTVIISTCITMGVILFFCIKYKRLWCHTLCPVGTFLGFFSKWALFKIHIDTKLCVDCKACAKECKSDTIDPNNNYRIDYSRCVSCYNCIDACKTGALKLRCLPKKKAHVTK